MTGTHPPFGGSLDFLVGKDTSGDVKSLRKAGMAGPCGGLGPL